VAPYSDEEEAMSTLRDDEILTVANGDRRLDPSADADGDDSDSTDADADDTDGDADDTDADADDADADADDADAA
jgi:hypothetical protein